MATRAVDGLLLRQQFSCPSDAPAELSGRVWGLCAGACRCVMPDVLRFTLLSQNHGTLFADQGELINSLEMKCRQTMSIKLL